MNYRRNFGNPVSRALRSTAFGLFVLIHFSAVSFGADVAKTCLLNFKPLRLTQQFGRYSTPPADRFEWSPALLPTTGTKPPVFSEIYAFDPGPAGGGASSMSGGGGDSGGYTFNNTCMDIPDLNAWFDPLQADGNPPVMTNMLPGDGATINEGATITVTAADQHDIAFQVYSDMVGPRYLLCQGTSLYNPSTHTFTLQLPVTVLVTGGGYTEKPYPITLAQGSRHVIIKAYDKGGLSSSIEAGYTVNNTWLQGYLDESASLKTAIDASSMTAEEKQLFKTYIDMFNIWQLDSGRSTIAQGKQAYIDAVTAYEAMGWDYPDAVYQNNLTQLDLVPGTEPFYTFVVRRNNFQTGSQPQLAYRIGDWAYQASNEWHYGGGQNNADWDCGNPSPACCAVYDDCRMQCNHCLVKTAEANTLFDALWGWVGSLGGLLGSGSAVAARNRCVNWHCLSCISPVCTLACPLVVCTDYQ